ncbi:MAG: hypothetical protein C4303_05830 [candidate division GAL15 bacterium]
MESAGQLNPALVELLACPACHGRLRQEGERLVCGSCRRRYPIREGIPVLLLEEAELPEGG